VFVAWDREMKTIDWLDKEGEASNKEGRKVSEGLAGLVSK